MKKYWLAFHHVSNFNLSPNFMVIDFSKLITFPLNVTLTTFQSTSKNPKNNVYLYLPCLASIFL